MSLNTVEMLVDDLDDARQLLEACQTYFTAQDIAKAQMAFTEVRPSLMSQQIERVKARLDGIFSDFLLQRYEEEKNEDDTEEEAEELEVEEEPEEVELVAEEEVDDLLSSNPLGSRPLPKQRGTRVSRVSNQEDGESS